MKSNDLYSANPLEDEFSHIELVAHSAFRDKDIDPDEMPVRAARVSHAANEKTGKNPEADQSLVNYLAKHRHTTPFEHLSATFLVVCPLFVAREWMRHRTQSFNEVSMRYTADPVGKIYVPKTFKQNHPRNKQASAEPLDENLQKFSKATYVNAVRKAIQGYNLLLEAGVSKEQARGLVPVANYTEFYTTANLLNWARFCTLRCSEDAQYEIRVYADAIRSILENVFPKTWGALSTHFV